MEDTLGLIAGKSKELTEGDLEVGEVVVLEAAAVSKPIKVHERAQPKGGGLRLQIRAEKKHERIDSEVDVTHLRSNDAQATPQLHLRGQSSGLINADAQIGVVVTGGRSEDKP